MITSKSKSWISRRIIFNESFLMVDKDDALLIFIEEFKLNINLAFSNEGVELSTTWNFNEERNSLDLTLHQWNNSLWIETTEPIELMLENNKKKIWIKFKTLADENKPFRTFHLTIWLEI